jgi:hypothetical protein
MGLGFGDNRVIAGLNMCIMVAGIPFMFADLYFVHNQKTCGSTKNANTETFFPITTWLIVSGYATLSLISAAVLYCLIYCLSEWDKAIRIVYNIYVTLWVCFRLIWLFVGIIIFIGYLGSNYLCDLRFSIYMGINLVVSFFLLIPMGGLQIAALEDMKK